MECDDRRGGHTDGGDKLPLNAGEAQAGSREQRICLRVERLELTARAQRRPDSIDVGPERRQGKEQDLSEQKHRPPPKSAGE
jgi:hypothetical protein